MIDVLWWRFEIYNKNEDLVKTLDKAMTEDEADDYAHELLHQYKASLVWHDRVSKIEERNK